jgi:hypothetical protein
MDIIGPMLDENELVLLVYMLAYAFGSSTTPQKKEKRIKHLHNNMLTHT